MIMSRTIHVTAKWFSKENHFAVIIYAAIVYIYIVVTTGRTPLHEQLFCRCEQRLFRVAAAEKTEQPPYSHSPEAMFTGFLFRRPYTVVFEPFLAAH